MQYISITQQSSANHITSLSNFNVLKWTYPLSRLYFRVQIKKLQNHNCVIDN